MSEKFDRVVSFATAISKSYAKDILKVLYLYKDVSASEAASRLGLHINTVQEFLEAMYTSGIVSREEVSEKKRPYYRYKLNATNLKFDLDLEELFMEDEESDPSKIKIREKMNSLATFNRAKNNLFFSSVTVLSGKGRERKEKRISLTNAQGVFLYNLPFPDGRYQSISEIMKIAQVDEQNFPEILDIVNLLIDHKVIEKK